MKSIKEKAEEYSFIKQGIDPSGIQYRDFNINKQEGFEAGANYVLDAITECLPKTMSCNPNEVIDIIVSMIKQLKK
jgi:hypothetical protein